MRAVWLMAPAVLACATVACGNDKSPVGPTGHNVVDVAGVWRYTATLTSVSGGECVGALIQSTIGSRDTGTMSVTQSGANLTATLRSDSDGSACNYTGTAGSNSISLGWTGCDLGAFTGIRCSNGTTRDMRMQTNSINATISGRTATGTESESWNVTTSFGTGVGLMTVTSSFTATK